MLDIKYIKENPEEVIARLAKKGKDAKEDIEMILKLDGERRTIIGEVELLKAEQNKTNKLIPQYKKEGKDVAALFAEMKALSAKTCDQKLFRHGLVLLCSASVFVHAQRIVGDHLFIDPLQSLLGSHAPVGGTGGNNFNQGEALAVDLILESLLDGLLGIQNILHIVNSHTGDVLGAFQGGEHLAHLDGPAAVG